MASLSEEDRANAIAILELVRARIAEAAGKDRERLFQVRRYVLKRLEFDERGTPTQRRKLKAEKRKRQTGSARSAGVRCRSAAPNSTASVRSTATRPRIHSWCAIPVIRRQKRSAELHDWSRLFRPCSGRRVKSF